MGSIQWMEIGHSPRSNRPHLDSLIRQLLLGGAQAERVQSSSCRIACAGSGCKVNMARQLAYGSTAATGGRAGPTSCPGFAAKPPPRLHQSRTDGQAKNTIEQPVHAQMDRFNAPSAKDAPCSPIPRYFGEFAISSTPWSRPEKPELPALTLTGRSVHTSSYAL